jgi:hypothetical protein
VLDVRGERCERHGHRHHAIGLEQHAQLRIRQPMTKLSELASTLRSKNAGVNQITCDIIFPDAERYRHVAASGAISEDSIARLFGIPRSRISHFVTFDAANAIKFPLYRLRPGSSPGDWDILGCQQYGPLLDLEIPD